MRCRIASVSVVKHPRCDDWSNVLRTRLQCTPVGASNLSQVVVHKYVGSTTVATVIRYFVVI